MKMLTAFMAIYMLTLSCLPCGDSADCIDEISTAISETLPHHENHEENCTPFCVCACCAVPIVQPNYFVVTPRLKPFCVSNIIFDEDFFSSNIHNIWQPPRQFIG